jgi:hypothetical protein
MGGPQPMRNSLTSSQNVLGVSCLRECVIEMQGIRYPMTLTTRRKGKPSGEG